MSNDFEIEPEEEMGKSKTQIKREMLALTELGERLVKLTPNELSKISLEPKLLEEIKKAQGIKKFSGLKRQLQYIGKLMRHTEVEEIEAALARVNQTNKDDAQKLHLLEGLRDELINQGDNAIATVLEQYPSADRQHLRQLIRQAQKELTQDKPPSFSRKIFRYLRELDNEAE